MPVIDPNIVANKQQYDEEYMKANPDVAQNGTMDAYTHYIRHGRAEGRQYGPPKQGLVSGEMQPNSGAIQPKQQMPKVSREQFGMMPGIMDMPQETLDKLYGEYENWLGKLNPSMFNRPMK